MLLSPPTETSAKGLRPEVGSSALSATRKQRHHQHQPEDARACAPRPSRSVYHPAQPPTAQRRHRRRKIDGVPGHLLADLGEHRPGRQRPEDQERLEDALDAESGGLSRTSATRRADDAAIVLIGPCSPSRVSRAHPVSPRRPVPQLACFPNERDHATTPPTNNTSGKNSYSGTSM